MSFTISWTGPKGRQTEECATAAEVLAEHTTRGLSTAINVMIKDDSGQKLSFNDVIKLVEQDESD